ncbi:parallel beta-helix repeat containing protein [Nitzschia inconspicua]|uniref:Parallel beta-helix repeat containing protein n=1 Tax=Nitzschia inconspicua TaxID=303405 RepID=A0A9K3KGF7_9STRA|nr:parallel beta-helix repeat containing protein [Nitzschia inconspicua]
MNFRTSALLIAIFVAPPAIMAINITSFRGSSPRKLRPINPENGQWNENIFEKEIACTLYLKEILLEPEIPSGDPLQDLENARTVTSWSCEVDDEEINGNAYGIQNNKRKNFKRFLDLTGVDEMYLDEHADSGNSILKVKGANMKFKELEITEEATFVIEDIPEERRRLAPSLGALKTKVIRVSGNNGAAPPTATAAQLKDDIFDDASCLKSQFAACSHGALTIIEGPIEEVTIATDPGGPAEFTKDWMEGNATALVAKGEYDLVLFCQPQTTGGWIAYAYINYWSSFYNNDWCQYVSVQLHEVGHNMNLAHAGEARSEYEDWTSMMGSGTNLDDEYMCFNSVNYYQLGWFPGQVADVAASTHMGSHAFVLNGVESAGLSGASNGKKIAVRVKNVNLEDTNLCCIDTQFYTDWRIRDIYLGYNFDSGTGINRDTAEYRNHVTVHQKDSNDPSAYSQSWLLAALQEGQEYTFPNFDGLGGGHTLHIKFSDQVNEDAFVEIYVTGITLTPNPTSPPSTNFPTSPPPTLPPPTSPPTKAPTPLPTRAPTPLPTRAPTPLPTRAPTRAPTPSPTPLRTTIFGNQNFEVGFGSVFISGGSNCARVLYSNRNCIRLRNNSGQASSMYTNARSVSGQKTLRLEFDYYSTATFLVEWRVPNGSWVIAGTVGVANTGFVRARVNFDSWVSRGRPGSIHLRIRSNTTNGVTYVDNVIFYGFK